jgi:hypothetical protein
MNFLIKLLLLVAIGMILQFTAVFASKLGDHVNRERIKKLKELNKRLIKQMKRFENDYLSIYENMVRVNRISRELKRENEALKQQLDKHYPHYINKDK